MTTTRDAPGALSRWLPVVVWAAAISLLSSDSFSGEQTRYLLLPVLHLVLPHAAPETLLAMHDIVRKLAHPSEYAVLGFLAARAYARPQRANAASLGLALAFCAAWAALDELHQSFVPSRTGAAADVALDTAGAIVGVALWAARRHASPRSRAQR
jgi:VanZ family protein